MYGNNKYSVDCYDNSSGNTRHPNCLSSWYYIINLCTCTYTLLLVGRHHSLEKTNPIPHLHVHVHVHYPCIVSAASLIKSLIYSFVLFQGWLTCSSCGYRTRTGLSCPVCGPKEEAVLREEVRERERGEWEILCLFCF